MEGGVAKRKEGGDLHKPVKNSTTLESVHNFIMHKQLLSS